MFGFCEITSVNDGFHGRIFGCGKLNITKCKLHKIKVDNAYVYARIELGSDQSTLREAGT